LLFRNEDVVDDVWNGARATTFSGSYAACVEGDSTADSSGKCATGRNGAAPVSHGGAKTRTKTVRSRLYLHLHGAAAGVVSPYPFDSWRNFNLARFVLLVIAVTDARRIGRESEGPSQR